MKKGKGKHYLNRISNSLSQIEHKGIGLIDEDLAHKQTLDLKTLEIDCRKHDGLGNPPNDDGILRSVLYFIKNRETELKEFPKSILKNLSFGFKTSFHGNRCILNREILTKQALAALDQHWKDRYLFGIYRTMLETWGEEKEGFQALQFFVSKKLERYEGESRRILLLKRNIQFVQDERGPSSLAKHLSINKDIDLKELPSQLGLKENEWTFLYFSEVLERIVGTLPRLTLGFLNTIKFILHHHSNDTTNKIVISLAIINIDKGNYKDSLKLFVKEMAVKAIGDPDRNDLWSVSAKMNVQKKAAVHKGRSILLKWITRRFIEVFFKKCINDKRRKQFWLKVADYVDDFWVAGSQHTRDYKLRGEKGIDELLSSRYKVVDYGSDVSALFMRIKNHLIIEFSDQSFACYAYLASNPIAPKKEDRIRTLNQLRDGRIPLAAKTSQGEIRESYPEGRLFHRGSIGETGAWENIFQSWFSEHVGIDVRI